MNVRLQYDVDFLAGVYYDQQLQMNQYSVTMNLLTKTKDSISTNVALDRVKLFIAGAMESTVFINQAHQEQAELLLMLGANVTTLPEDPVDQIVGMMLYYKLNAIMEGRMEIVNLDLSSTLGDSVWYQHDEEDSAGPFAVNGWWHASSMQHDTLESEPVPANVVKVMSTGWHEMNLDWPENNTGTDKSKVLYANFPRNEK